MVQMHIYVYRGQVAPDLTQNGVDFVLNVGPRDESTLSAIKL